MDNTNAAQGTLKLRITAGPGTGQLYTFPGYKRVLVGRDARCNLCVHDDGCSRRHFEIFVQEDCVWVQDLNSANGTKLNDLKVDKAVLSNGDSIQAGSTEFLVLECPLPGLIGDMRLKVQDLDSEVVLSLPQADASLLALRGGVEPVVELERENTVLREVCEMAQLIATSDDRKATTDMLVERVLSLLDADGVCYIEPIGQDEEWEIKSSASATDAIREVAVSRTLIQLALTQNVAILSTDPLRDNRFSPGQSILLHRISSAICSPLFIDDEPIGVLFIVRRNRAETLNTFDLRVAATVANVLALFIKKSALAMDSRRQERLAVIGEVVAGLAHYAKNIIMGLDFSLANVHSCLQRKDYTKMEDNIASIEAQQKRLSNLVQDMLNYAKDRVPDRQPTNLATLLSESITAFAARLEKAKIELKIEVADGLPDIHADETALNRVFLNLITNAFDAIEEGAGEMRQAGIVMKQTDDGASVHIEFSDTGSGISASNLPHIFEVMYSTKGSRGTGIGLAVVKKIVEEHGGKVSVHSEEGKGSTFTIKLPLK